MSKGQKGLPAAVLIGFLAAIANSSGALATPLAKSAPTLESVESTNAQAHRSDTKNVTNLKVEQDADLVNLSLFDTTEFIPSTADLTEAGTDEAAFSLQILDVQISQSSIDLSTSPESNTESSSPEPQAEPSQSSEPNLESSSDPQATPGPSQSSPEPQPTASRSNRWHFLFQPYIYVPLSIYGDATLPTRRTSEDSRDFAIESDQIKSSIENNLNFAFLGELQGWSPDYRWGVLTNVDYLSASSDDTFTRSLRFPGLADFVPTELQADLDVELWSVDLAAAYRIYDPSQINPEGVSTEFDLGPFVFDIIGGANFVGIDTDLNLRTNLGRQANFDADTSVLSPLVGARLRINLSPNFALVSAGSFSGFGIDGLTRWSARTGIDWMFSGDTSVGVGYRFAHASYNTELGNGEDFGLTVNQNGPYLSFSFRF